MAVMAAMSRGSAGRMDGSMIGGSVITEKRNNGRLFFVCQSVSSILCCKKSPGGGRGFGNQLAPEFSTAIAEEAQHEQEQVDEVEIERQCPHHRLAADDGTILLRIVHLLDPLRVPRGEAREDEHAGGR